MPNYWNMKHLGLAVLLFVSIRFSAIDGISSIHADGNIPWVRQSFNLPLAPVFQDTAYPSEPTATVDNGYPGQPTSTESSVATSSSSTQTTEQSTVSLSPTLLPGTPSVTPGNPNDLFLTENAEMGLSQATPLPSKTSTPTSTQTITTTSIAPTEVLASDQGFNMNWGGFSIGFIAIVLVGGGVGWWVFRHREVKTTSKDNHDEPSPD